MTTTSPVTLHLPPQYLAQVSQILHTHLPNAEVWAYGSRVHCDHYDASGLDLVVRQPDRLEQTQENLADVREAFTQSNLPILVQIVDWARIPDSFHREIEAGYVVVQRPA